MKRDLIVLKYGGSSVSDENKIKMIAKDIKYLKENNKDIIVVVSAMGKQTDSLIKMAYNISKHPPKREIDMLLTTGERISISLLSIALNDIGINAISFTGSQSGIITDCSHTKAKINKIKPFRIIEEINKGKVVIVAGFQGVSFEKEITTLGRGGSDLTAIALGISLKASECHINTDVDGIYPVDPRIINKVDPYKRLSFVEASLFASTGAKVMHDRACSLASLYKFPYIVKSSFNSKGGTLVMNNNIELDYFEDVKENPFIKGITSKKDLIIFSINNPDIDNILKTFSENDINIYNVFIQQDRIIILIEEYEYSQNLNKIENFILKKYNINTNKGFLVSILGEGFNNFPGSIYKINKILKEINIKSLLISSSNIVTSILFLNDYDHDTVIKNFYENLEEFFIKE